MRNPALRGLRVPGPPAELRESVLRAAHAVPSGRAGSSASWRAAWEWVRPELSWMAAAAALLLCHALLFPSTKAAAGGAVATASRGERQQMAELRQVGVAIQPRGSASSNGRQDTERLLREAGLERM